MTTMTVVVIVGSSMWWCFLPLDFKPVEPAAPFAAPTALDDLGDFAITDMTTLDQDEVGKGMILVGEVTIGDGGNLLLFAKKWKSWCWREDFWYQVLRRNTPTNKRSTIMWVHHIAKWHNSSTTCQLLMFDRSMERYFDCLSHAKKMEVISQLGREQ